MEAVWWACGWEAWGPLLLWTSKLLARLALALRLCGAFETSYLRLLSVISGVSAGFIVLEISGVYYALSIWIERCLDWSFY